MFSIKDNAIILADFFQGRADAFCVQRPDGSYVKVNRPLTTDEFVKHLQGIQTIGVYLISPKDGLIRFCAIDMDSTDVPILKRIIYALQKAGLKHNQFVLEDSGNRGFHVFIRFENAIQPKKARQLLTIILKLAEADTLEIFPKQDGLSQDKKSYGSMIKVPCGIHKKSKRHSTLLGLDLKPVDITALNSVKRVSEETANEILYEFGYLFESSPSSPNDAQLQNTANSLTCFSRMLLGVPEGWRDESAFHLAIHLKRQGFDKEMATTILTDWNNHRNVPPLEEEVIKAKIERVYAGQYLSYGCNNQLIRQFCSDDCPIKRAMNRQNVILASKEKQGQKNQWH